MSSGLKLILAVMSATVMLTAGLWLACGVLGGTARGKRVAKALNIPRPAVIAHRGASHLAPESTVPAYLMARELGADYLEIDLQRTKDGTLVVVHDDDLSRTTNVAEVFPGREKDTIDTFTFAELAQLDAGSWFNRTFPDRARGSFKGLRILRMDEVIALAESGTRRPGLYIETKAASRFPGIEEQLVGALRQRGWIEDSEGPPSGRVIFQSFEPNSLVRLKSLAPRVPRLLLLDELMVAREGLDSLMKIASDVGSGVGTWGVRWAFSPYWSLTAAPKRYLTTWPWHTGQAHEAGLFVHPWTINERWEMWMVTLSGADGFFTDRADVALAVVGKPGRDEPQTLWNRIGY
ncbi:Glycerophosphoryl diester phosphodiesterase [Nitrospira japonica]|uniref:Glycerophosphoryl diester phosphodiesterase n=1 Tax=Nitrospira japonica TaxID=1325564 RepID=A0A1W1I2B1_9BACT|nr:glycerophosphodiester phosphodiesterase family protein [Nitrospira japonica]SLM47150.1 Glycerophosphoryl diester phosphodiesterase [Nitrospira japonica]